MIDIEDKAIDLKTLDLTYSVAVDLVNKCRDIPEKKVVEYLLAYINALENATRSLKWDEVEPVAHIVGKGFKRISEDAGALKFYYLGYYAHIQEELIKTFPEKILKNELQQLTQTRHIKEILEYLYEFGCRRQGEIAKALSIDKSNLSRKIEILVENGVIKKRSGPKFVFYELSADGYEYCRKNGVVKLNRGKSIHDSSFKNAFRRESPSLLESQTYIFRAEFKEKNDVISSVKQELIGKRNETSFCRKNYHSIII